MKIKGRIAGSKVHDVGYRVFLLRKALEIGVERFNAYNAKENGTDVLFAILDADEEQTSEFRDFIMENRPENASVSNIAFEDFKGHVLSITDYMNLIQVEQLSKGIPAILSIDKKQDKMLEKQDKMLEKQDKMLEKQDMMLEKQAMMLGKQDMMLEKQDMMLGKQDMMIEKLDETKNEVVREIRELRWDLKSYLDEKLIRIESDIAHIKEKIGLTT